ncbi:MAG: HAD family hydrolase [Eubacterium sp.]|nr:HAD family hydrolase [Eubacterium sp.]
MEIIFDLDGTLWDSSDTVAASWTDTLRRLDMPELNGLTLTAADLQSGMGMTMTALAEKYFPMLPPEKQLEVLGVCMEEENKYIAVHGGRLFDREEETLKALKAQHRLFIVSNCQCGYIEAFLTYTGFGKYFDGHMCWGDTRMPKSFTIGELIKRQRCENPIYVGDTQGDCDAAYDAGVPFVHAAYGFGVMEKPERVSGTVESFAELLTCFTK